MEHPSMEKAPLHTEPEADSELEEQFFPQKRPFGVTLFLWMVLSLSAWGLLRLFAAIRWWGVLAHYSARLNPFYLSLTGAAWTVTGVVLLWSIWSGKRWVHPALPIAIALWLVEYWLER